MLTFNHSKHFNLRNKSKRKYIKVETYGMPTVDSNRADSNLEGSGIKVDKLKNELAKIVINKKRAKKSKPKYIF